MGIRRAKHAVYDLKYHLVWIPKYGERLLDKEVADYLKEVLRQIAEEYEFGIRWKLWKTTCISLSRHRLNTLQPK